MFYDELLFKVLEEAGEGGLSVRKLVLHLQNASSTLFSQTGSIEARGCVDSFIQRHMRCAPPTIERVGRGVYRMVCGREDGRAQRLPF